MALGLVSPIRDVIHDYISPTVFEREIIDSRYYQRLHFVLQNSTVYSTYPCNKNSRFVHSLGVSHLAGRMFIQALKNANSDTLLKFLKETQNFIQGFHFRGELLEEQWAQQIGNASRFLHNPLDGIDPIRDEKPEGLEMPVNFLVNTYWIAIRICGLCHDIGHMPSSHLFEHALKHAPTLFERYADMDASQSGQAKSNLSDVLERTTADLFSPARESGERNSEFELYAKTLYGGDTEELKAYVESEMAEHELRGYQILDHILKTSEDHDKTSQLYRDLVMKLSMAIFLACAKKTIRQNSKLPTFLNSIRQIIAGEIDADRLDYTARDAAASGIELGALDLERIVTSFILVERDTGSGNPTEYVICPTTAATSAIGSFFHQRYLSYENIIYHKAVQRADLVMEEIISHLLYFSFIDPRSKIAQLCAQSHMIKLQGEGAATRVAAILPFDQFFRFDDGWLRALIADVWDVLEHQDSRSHQQELLRNLLKCYFDRDTSYCYIILKDRMDARLTGLELKNDEFAFVVDKSGSEESVANYLNRINKQLISESTAMFFRYISPKLYRAPVDRDDPDAVWVYDKSRSELIALEDASPYVSSLVEVADRTPNLFLMLFGENIRQNCQDRKEDLVNPLLTGLADAAKGLPQQVE